MRLNNYNYRLYFYKFLETLPNFLGDYIYLRLQKTFGQLKPEKYLNSGMKFKNSLNLENVNDGTSIIEIGTGWFPIVPYLVIGYLKLSGHKTSKLYTYDLRKLCSKENQLSTLKLINIAPDTVSKFNYFPGIDLTNHTFGEIIEHENVLVFSKATLQHIPKEIIKDIHLNLIKHFPKHEVVHLINCNDHRQHTDYSLSKYEFLKYSENKWFDLYTRFDYHNRMRINEYVRLFEEIGYVIDSVSFEKANERDMSNFNNDILPCLDDRFKKFSVIDNTAGSLLFKLKYQK
jgi:hypothetical protein